MHQINHLPPERMTPEQRRHEIASLLANGLARLRIGGAEQSARQRQIEVVHQVDDALPNHITLFDLAVDPLALWDEQRERINSSRYSGA